MITIGCHRNNNVIAINDDCIGTDIKKDFSNCDYIYEPVCGCDNNTYRNACFAKHSGLADWKVGPCKDQCISNNIIISDEICTREYRPVCGCNDITYSNPCVARKSGVTTYHLGKCDESADR